MATKLDNLEITNVDFVPRGANQKANILITKDEKDNGLLNKLIKALTSVFKDNDTEPVEKAAATFSEMLTEHQIYLILDEVRAANCALGCSIESILTDEESVDKASLMNQSLAEFNSAMQSYIQKWASGQLVGITKSETKNTEPVIQIEEENELNIDKSKLTAEEQSFLAKIEAKAGSVAETAMPKGAHPENKTGINNDDVMSRFDGIMKALDNTVAKIENDKLAAIAKKYEILGMKQEELIPFFKDLKKDQAMYDSVIAKFDAAVKAIETSGLFNEICKRGLEDTSSSVVTKIAKIADDIQKKNPGIGRVKAEQMAWEQHPELVAEYENQA